MTVDLKSEKFRGLSEDTVKEKINKDGYNELPSSKPKNLFALAWGVVREPMFLLLVACGSLYLVLGDVNEEEIIDSLGIFVLISFIEEQFNVKINPDEVVLDNFETIDTIKFLVMSKLGSLEG